MRSFILPVVLCVATMTQLAWTEILASSTPAPDCTTGFPNVPSSFATNKVALGKNCLAICGACVTSNVLLMGSTTCLNISTSTPEVVFTGLPNIAGGACVHVLTGVNLTQTLFLGNGSDCVVIQAGAIVGDVYTGYGDDSVIIQGTVRNVYTGAGDDYVYVSTPMVKRDVAERRLASKKRRESKKRTPAPAPGGYLLDTADGNDQVLFSGAGFVIVQLGNGMDYIRSINSTTYLEELDTGDGVDYVVLEGDKVGRVELGRNSDEILLVNTTLNYLGTGPGDDQVGYLNSTIDGMAGIRNTLEIYDNYCGYVTTTTAATSSAATSSAATSSAATSSGATSSATTTIVL